MREAYGGWAGAHLEPNGGASAAMSCTDEVCLGLEPLVDACGLSMVGGGGYFESGFRAS